MHSHQRHRFSPPAATKFLESTALTPGFSILILQLADNAAVEASVRLQAATFFKNHIKAYWNVRSGVFAGPGAVRNHIRGFAVGVSPRTRPQRP